MAVVYWIHKPEHTNILSEGYIGVSSKSAEHRFTQHKQETARGSPYPVHRALRKYGETLVVDTLLEGSVEYCYFMEERLRPAANIAWNVRAGGNVAPMQGKSHSQATRDKMSANSPRKGRPHTPEQRAKMIASRTGKKFTEAHKEAMRVPKKGQPWNRALANTEMWLLAHDVFVLFKENEKIASSKINRLMGITVKTAANILKKLKLGWVPAEDPEWLAFKQNTGAIAYG